MRVFPVVQVVFVLPVLLFVISKFINTEFPAAAVEFANLPSHVGSFAEPLGEDMSCTKQCAGNILNSLVLVHKVGSTLVEIGTIGRFGKEFFSQVNLPCVAGFACQRLFFGFEGKIEVLQSLEVRRLFDL